MAASQLHHYVPRFVLRRFCVAATQDVVHAYDKHGRRKFVASTGKVAAERALYDFEFDGDELTLEPGLAEIEGRAASHIDRILTDGYLHPSDPLERDELARLFAVQLVRTPAHKQMSAELTARMEAYLKGEGIEDEFFAVDPCLGSRENADRVQIAKTLLAAPQRFGPSFIGKDWVLMRAGGAIAYQIGDHPLTMHNSRDAGLRGNLGLNVQGIEIYFPLSPRLVLGMMCQSHFRRFQEALPWMTHAALRDRTLDEGITVALAYSSAVQSGQPADLRPENVEFLNSLQVAHAERFLFSCDGDFSVAENMIAANSELSHGPRFQEATGKF